MVISSSVEIRNVPSLRLARNWLRCFLNGFSAQSNKRQDRGDEKPNDHGGDQNQCNSFGQSVDTFAHEKSFRTDAWSNEYSLL